MNIPQNAIPTPPVNSATTAQKILLCICLIILSAGTLFGTYYFVQRANEIALAESTAPWLMPEGAQLRIGPATFHYDPDRKLLSHRGPLDAAEQLQLRDLLEFDAEREPPLESATSLATPRAVMAGFVPRPQHAYAVPSSSTRPSAPVTPASGRANSSINTIDQPNSTNGRTTMSAADVKSFTRTYHAAINLLAYKAQASQAEYIQMLLLLGTLGGVLGAFLRSFVDFVGNACYKNDLNLIIWWPLYATRPVVGAILGFLLVVLFKARLMTNAEVQTGADTYWWLGMAAIGGFSTIDVTARLRHAAKALFGGNEGKSS